MALLGKGIKAAGAVAIVAVLSIILVVSDLTSEGHAGFIYIYGIGAAAGLVVSLAAAVLMKRRIARMRAVGIVLTAGVLFGGAAVVSMESVAGPLVGEAASDTGILILNYALGYFLVGVTIDALRVRRIRKLRESGK